MHELPVFVAIGALPDQLHRGIRALSETIARDCLLLSVDEDLILERGLQHRLRGRLDRQRLAREAQVLYGVMGMVLGLAEAMVIHRRGFIDSENRLLAIALDRMADEPEWQHAFRIAAGHEAASAMERGRAALALYGETARIVAPLMAGEERRVANVGLAAASQALNRSFGLPIS